MVIDMERELARAIAPGPRAARVEARGGRDAVGELAHGEVAILRRAVEDVDGPLENARAHVLLAQAHERKEPRVGADRAEHVERRDHALPPGFRVGHRPLAQERREREGRAIAPERTEGAKDPFIATIELFAPPELQEVEREGVAARSSERAPRTSRRRSFRNGRPRSLRRRSAGSSIRWVSSATRPAPRSSRIVSRSSSSRRGSPSGRGESSFCPRSVESRAGYFICFA